MVSIVMEMVVEGKKENMAVQNWKLYKNSYCVWRIKRSQHVKVEEKGGWLQIVGRGDNVKEDKLELFSTKMWKTKTILYFKFK